MQFLMMYRPDRKEDVPLSLECMAELGKNCEELAKAGVLVMSAGLQPSAKGARPAFWWRDHRDRRAVHRGEGNHRWR